MSDIPMEGRFGAVYGKIEIVGYKEEATAPLSVEQAAIDDMLLQLSKAPPGQRAQIDESITPRLLGLIGKGAAVQALALKDILDDCAYAALASDFAMMAMDATWRMAQKEAAK